ncbi:MAG: uridine phosphorylase [Chloroflexi bacterium]|nr:uridine phosphorylase [Chloroflexota bacterium]MCL5075317.1 uridine phosphorylase [Chloroflexota bacterium]
MAGKLQYHIRCSPEDVAKYVLLPGDPDRVKLIAQIWDEWREVSSHREHVTYSGKVSGIPITACSTGVGGPSAANALEELAELGADTFIRVGTTGALWEHINCGDLIITSGAVRYDGTSPYYVDLAYPACANYEVIAALVEAAERLGHPYHVGISASTASFFCGQARPGFKDYWQSWMEPKITDLRAAKVLNFEMEAGTILTLSNLFDLRAGAVCAVVANRITDKLAYVGVDRCIAVAVEAVKILHEWDQKKAALGKQRWYPSLTATYG